MNWFDVLPSHIALAQTGWERRRRIERMMAAGLTRKHVAAWLGISYARVVQLVDKARRDSPVAPVQEWWTVTPDKIVKWDDHD